ncbi:MAG: LysM peptidoglycan-binding domain-containing protein [Endozoicomonadaceae bacterium]|nr:LysM peptidoglycan-binding domain-containing protein [Endozoicomonadaceae bacterium]
MSKLNNKNSMNPLYISGIFHTCLKWLAPGAIILSFLSGCTQKTLTAQVMPVKHNSQYSKNLHTTASEYDELWHRIKAGLSTSVHQYSNPRIDYYIQWFSKHPYHFQSLMERARPYLYYIMDEVDKRNMPSEFALVPAVESAFDPFAYSNGLASGLWQITPSTGRYYEIKQDWWFDGRRDIITATKFALNYFQELYQNFNSWELALAAYNAGYGTVSKAIQRNLKKQQPIGYWNLKLPKQTENYVPKLLAVAKIIQNPAKYNIVLKPIPNQPHFEIVDTGSQLDLDRAAQFAQITQKELRQLNPGYNRWATDPNGPYHLLIPVNNATSFREQLALIAPNERISWHRYTVHSGDTLSSVANAFNIGVDVIKTINHLENDIIYVGEPLLIPQPVDNKIILNHEQKALALAQAKNIASDKDGRIRYHYIVRPADNLWTIAKSHNLLPEQIQKWNHLKKDATLHPGQKLLLWVGQDNHIRYNHVVQPGDSLWRISKKYRTSIEQLTAWNSITSSSILKPKQELIIWRKIADDTTLKPQFSHPGSVIRKVYYTVKRGESIHNIADKFRVAVSQISNWNTLKNIHLQTGQKLTLFVDVTRTE